LLPDKTNSCQQHFTITHLVLLPSVLMLLSWHVQVLLTSCRLKLLAAEDQCVQQHAKSLGPIEQPQTYRMQ
jgi:hypothetical protein